MEGKLPHQRFQDGDVHTFLDAVGTYMFQMRQQMQVSRNMGASDAELEEWHGSIAQLAENIQKAAAIYQSVVTPAIEEAARQLKEQNDPLLNDFAQGLLTGDYTHLSV